MASPPEATPKAERRAASDKHTRVYRIVSDKYPPFDGGGAWRWGSRWIDPGRTVVHAASSYSLAVLENLVHWQASELPPTLVCVVATIPDAVSPSSATPVDLDDAIKISAPARASIDRRLM